MVLQETPERASWADRRKRLLGTLRSNAAANQAKTQYTGSENGTGGI